MAHTNPVPEPVRFTDANRLYLYRLLAEGIGIGRQTFLPKAAEVLAAADLTPEALGYESDRALFEALGEGFQLTAFKGGRFYVTVVRNEAWDAALAQAEEASAKKAKAPKGGKSWKRKKGSLKPQRPKTLAPKAEEPQVAAGAVTESEAERATDPATAPAPGKQAPEAPQTAPSQTAPSQASQPAPEARPHEAGPQEPAASQGGTSPDIAAEEQAAAGAHQLATSQAKVASTAAQGDSPDQAATDDATERRLTLLEQIEAQLPRESVAAESPVAVTAPAEAPTASVAIPGAAAGASTSAAATTGTSTSAAAAPTTPHAVPATGTSRGAVPTAPEPAPEAHPAAAQSLTTTMPPVTGSATSPAAPAPAIQEVPIQAAPAQPVAPAAGSTAIASAPARHDDLPRSFADDVSVKPALLGLLTRMLPIDADLMGVLTEDFRVARATGTATGSRSRVTFPLRYLQEDASAPVMVTIRRNARPGDGRRWQLSLVDGDDGTGDAHEAVGLEGLPQASGGCWAVLAPADAGPAGDPVRDLAQFMEIGTWDAFLGTVATAAAPERWNYPGEGVGKPSRYGILRDYLASTLARVRAQGLLAVSADGATAAFNTGLVSPMLEELYVVLEATGSDIPWRFAGVCEAGSGQVGGRLVSAFETLPGAPVYLAGIDDVRPRPQALVIPDYRALLTDGLSRLPRAFLSEQLEGGSATGALQALDGAATLPERDRLVRDLARAIEADPSRRRRLCRAIDDAINLSLRRARQSYRHVAPAYDAARDRTLLLLPLALVDDTRADCALALELMPSGAYQAASAVSLSDAYAAARVVSREMPAWLAPEAVLG